MGNLYLFQFYPSKFMIVSVLFLSHGAFELWVMWCVWRIMNGPTDSNIIIKWKINLMARLFILKHYNFNGLRDAEEWNKKMHCNSEIKLFNIGANQVIYCEAFKLNLLWDNGIFLLLNLFFLWNINGVSLVYPFIFHLPPSPFSVRSN